MHRLILIMIALITTPVLADGVTIIKNNDSPELKRCIKDCGSERDTTARESCDIKCAKAEIERNKQKQPAPTSQPGR